MAAGKTVVATRVGGNTEMLEEGALGYLVEPGSPSSLADAIRLALPEALLHRERPEQAKKVIERYSPQRMVEQYLEIYAAADGG